MIKNKIIDCITFFDNNFMFDLRYNILKDHVDYFVICESKFDHKNKSKKLNFIKKHNHDSNKIKYIVMESSFPENTNVWQNQAIQREFLLKNLNTVAPNDYIFFSDPDEIPNPQFLENFTLSKKYGIFLQKCFNYKFNLFNSFETPWEGTRVCKKKDLKSIDFMRQKIKSKNLKYKFFRVDKEKNIELFENSGWHFNNIMEPELISIKLKSFAHTEFSAQEFSSVDMIRSKIEKKIDLFNRGHQYKKVDLDSSFPEYLLENYKLYKSYIL
tara:strand:+ start:2264 stop:3073 length:810 start_codon:yes stop_codon:yes gene_type:complete